jgi:hypothetical protein
MKYSVRIEAAKSVFLQAMNARWLTLLAVAGLALTLSGQALAKPPEEEAIDRAEKAAERAAKASERAAEAAERAAERDMKDSRDRDNRAADKDGGHDSDRQTSDGDKVELASLDPSDSSNETIKSQPATSSSGGSTSEDGDSNQSGSTESSSGSDDAGEEWLSGSDSGTSGGSGGDDSSGSTSGSNESGDSGSDGSSGSSGGSGDSVSDDSSGSNSGSNESGDDDDDSDDDNNKGSGHDQKFGIIPVENDEAGNPYREGELVVMSDDAGLVSRAQSLGFGIIEQRPLESIGAVVARLRRPEGVTSNQALELLRTSEPASASGYNYLYRATGKVPVDQQQDVPAPLSPVKHERNKTTSIGLIDGFSADTIGAWKVERLVDKPAMAGHGDAVAGIVLRDLANAYSAEPDRLILLDVMRGQTGKGAADVAALVFAFDRLVTARVGVVNLSLAGPDHPALQRAVSQSLKSGMVVVAAVGNEGPAAPPAFPAAYDGVIGVSAVDSSGKPYLYSGRGAHVDIAALGFEVSPTAKGGELVGTSYAAPHVTAMIAGEQKRRKGGSLDSLLAEFAEDAGAPGRDPIYGLGILALDKPARLAQAAQSSNH